MEAVHIAVMDYCCNSVKFYNILLKEDWQTEDVEDWLYENTDYKNDQCYYMASKDAIETSIQNYI